MFDFAIYGQLVVDNIFDGDFNTMNLGGIANTVRAFNEIDNVLKIGISPMTLGYADIFIERLKNNRSSVASLNEHLITPIKLLNSRVHHFMYINELENLQMIPFLEGVLTADTCKGKELKDPNLIKLLDYIFVSDEDCQDLDFLVSNIERGVFFHTKYGCDYISRENKYTYKIPQNLIVKNANVLGAGDMFAAGVLYSLYYMNLTEEDAIQNACIFTSNMIRKYNEKV
jgi:hypothetical protein